MAERTGTYFYCSSGHGGVVFEVMRGTTRDYARCPVSKCGSLVTFARGSAPELTREQALAAMQSMPARMTPMTLEDGLLRIPDAVVLPVPTGDELQRLDDEADQILEEIEAEEQADLDLVDGGDWPPSEARETR